MTPDESKEFLHTCDLLGINPFEGLGYQVGQKFKLSKPLSDGVNPLPKSVTLLKVPIFIKGYAWFKGEDGKKYLLFINQVIPDEPTRVPSTTSDMSDTGD